MHQDPSRQSVPEVSVLVTGAARVGALRRLLERLGEQSTEASAFEVIVVVDWVDPAVAGSVAGAATEAPYACTLIQRQLASAAEARNIALSVASAPIALFLDGDAVPESDLVERHLAAHSASGDGVAILGSSPFTEDALSWPLVRMLDASTTLRPITALEHGAEVGWGMFRATNLSVAVAPLVAAGGFDEATFGAVGSDDVELGLRLAERGLRVLFHQDCVAYSDRVTHPTAFVARAFDAGRAVARMEALHGDVVPCWPAGAEERVILEDSIVGAVEESFAGVEGMIASLESIEEQFRGEPLCAEELEAASERLIELAQIYRLAGLHRERTGVDIFDQMISGPPEGTTLTVVIASAGDRGNMKRCVEAVRQGADPRFCQEVFVVTGGADGDTTEWLESQPDMTLIRLSDRSDAPGVARQILTRATGEWVAFLDSAVIVPHGWQGRALYHGAVDPRVGAVALRSNSDPDEHRLDYDGAVEPAAVEDYAARHFASTGRRGADVESASSPALLVRRAALARAAEIDCAFEPSGFESADLTRQVRSAGWRTRVALDSFVVDARTATGPR